MSNGCGCEKGVLRYFKPPYAKLFYTPCCMHDDDYDRGGDKYSRLYADKMLYWRMMKIVQAQDITPTRATWMIFIAFAYYLAVRLMGWRYFNYTIHDD